LKILTASFCSTLLIALIAPASADESVTVKATIQSELVSLSVDKTTIDYGLVNYSSDENNPSFGVLPDVLNVTNNGNVAADIMVKGSNAVERGDNNKIWTLTAGPVAQNQFRHAVAQDGVNYVNLISNNYATLQPNVPASSLVSGLDMRFSAPLMGSNAGTFDTNVYFLAVKH